MINLLRKLGAELFGSNEDLIPVRDPSDSDDVRDGDPDSDETTEGEDADGESGESGEDAEDADGESGEGADGSGDSDEGDEGGDGDDSPEGGDSEGGDEGDVSGKGESDGGGESGGDEAGDSAGGDTESGDDEAGDLDGAGEHAPSDEIQTGGNEAGGNSDLGDDPQAFIEAILAGLEDPDSAGLKDNNEAMSEATEACREDDCEAGEAVWRPYDESADKIVKPKGNKKAADAYRQTARVLTAALKAQFRRKFLQARDPREQHGVRRGRDLSERRLVESFIEIKSNVVPSRPDYRIEERQDVSLALAVVGDESGSMHGRPAAAAATAMIALAESFDSLGAPVMCCGPRNGRGTSSYYNDRDAHEQVGSTMVLNGGYHRWDASRIDLFMDWDESFRQCKDRFGAYTASGGTPLSDGIQYAIRALNERTERHRVVLVLTDGSPDNPSVVRRQIRLAREAGIHVIGVGIESGEYYVPQLFPEHIVVSNLDALPKRMMEVVGGIVFPKRSRKAALDGGTKRRRVSR